MAIDNSRSDGLSALLNGETVKAIALLHNDLSPGAAYAQVRALFRLRNFERAIDFSKSVNMDYLEYEEDVALSSLQIFILARMGQVDEAFLALPLLAAKIKHNDLLGKLEYQYIFAYLQYCKRRYSESLQILFGVLSATSQLTEDSRRFKFQSDAFIIRAKSGTLIGVIKAICADYLASERAHCDALLSAEQANPRDSFLEALILANLSCVLCQVQSDSALTILRDRVKRFHWNDGLEEHRVYVDRHLRMASLLFGDTGEDQKGWGRSAPSLAYRLAECLDSLLLDEWRSCTDYQNELDFSKTLISRVDWLKTDGEEYLSLNEMIPLLAPFDLNFAADVRAKFRDKQLTAVPHIASSSPIDQAAIKFADACIAKAEQDYETACNGFRAAINSYEKHGVAWRSAIAMVELCDLTSCPDTIATLERYTKSLTRSPFSRRLNTAVKLLHATGRSKFSYLGMSMCRSS